MGYSPLDHKVLDITEHHHHHIWYMCAHVFYIYIWKWKKEIKAWINLKFFKGEKESVILGGNENVPYRIIKFKNELYLEAT